MRILTIIALTLFTHTLFAQEFMALLIPDSLKQGADVVKRYEEYVLEIKSPGKAKIYERHVYTILNEAARSYTKYRTYYDKFTSINSVSGTLYNFFGKEIKHLKKKDWQDMSTYDGISLMTDNRVKVNEFFYTEYPYTVDYEEEDETEGVLDFTDWYPVSAYRMSVQQSKYTIIAPSNYEVRYKQMNFTTAPTITEKDGKKIYTWEIKNIPAYKYEEAAPYIQEIVPNIHFAPSALEAEGYVGNMTSWESYGKFFYQLVKGRDALPADIKSKVHELTDNLKSDKEKIFVLYNFLQKNTHYISIQLGIGGWQPFDATYVAEKKYGDCKALSNYMIALLKEAGIKAKYAEIYGGKDHPLFMEDFPCLQSNHVISCVPMGKDTIWLECTSQTKSPGYMGSFTGNRKAVIIDEEGGHVVNTPKYKASDNLQRTKVIATINEEGLLDAEIKTHYTGIEEEFPNWLMNEASKEDREKYLNDMFNLPTYQVVSNNYKEEKAFIPSVDEDLHIQARNYASITGKRFFVAPNIFGLSAGKLIPDTMRKYDYIIKNSFIHIDTAEIKIPAGYKLESKPKDIFLETKFGNYKMSVQAEDDKIIYYRKREQNSARIPAKEYNDLVKYFEQVYKADRAKIVFVKSE